MIAEDRGFPHPVYARHVLQPAYRDAQRYLYEPMLAANRAHIVMLHECEIIDQACAAGLLQALDVIEREGLEALEYKAGVEDLFFRVEGRLVELTGPEVGGNLQLARSRNDLGVALFRLALRTLLLQVRARLDDLRAALYKQASEHLHTLMPGYTHTQPAQPTTFAHYLTGVLSSMGRDAHRLRKVYHLTNSSPLGAAAFTGTGFPIDRKLVAELLGFEQVIESTHDSIAAVDYMTETAGTLTTLAITLGRMTQDLLFWCTQEAGALHIDDSFIQISSIMPQKRNPVVLEHLRARLSRLIGQCQTVIWHAHNIPFGDNQDVEDEVLPALFGATETAAEVLELYAAMIAGLTVDAEHVRSRAAVDFTTATELADALVRHCRLSFRDAHGVVSAVVDAAVQDGLTPAEVDAVLVVRVARQALGRPLEIDEEFVRAALDPEGFVQARKILGGVAPAATEAVLESQSVALETDRGLLVSERRRLDEADAELRSRAALLIASHRSHS